LQPARVDGAGGDASLWFGVPPSGGLLFCLHSSQNRTAWRRYSKPEPDRRKAVGSGPDKHDRRDVLINELGTRV